MKGSSGPKRSTAAGTVSRSCWRYVRARRPLLIDLEASMHKASERAIALLNASLRSGERVCIRMERGRIASLHEKPEKRDVVIDLRGARVMPGLVNAHDHLHLNTLPPLKYREDYRNASQWI